MPDVVTPFGRILLTDTGSELTISLARHGRLWPIATWRPGTGYVPEAPEGVPWSGAVHRELVAVGLIVPWSGDPTTDDAQRCWRREAIAALSPYCGNVIARWVRRRRAAVT